jgi:hypothetical protein
VVTVFTAVALTVDDVMSEACLAMMSKEGRRKKYKHAGKIEPLSCKKKKM